MFELIVMLFVVANGVQAEKPAGIIKNKTTFPTEAACKNYFGTEEGRAAKLAVDEFLASQEGRITARLGCIKQEDNTI
jgi:hypothetical protein